MCEYYHVISDFFVSVYVKTISSPNKNVKHSHFTYTYNYNNLFSIYKKKLHHQSQLINFFSGMVCKPAVAVVAVCFSLRTVLAAVAVAAAVGTVVVLLAGDWQRCSPKPVGSLEELVVV